MKREEHDWLSAKGLSEIKWIDNKSVSFWQITSIQRLPNKLIEGWQGLKKKSRFHAQVLFMNTTNLWAA